MQGNQYVATQQIEWTPLDEPGVAGISVKVLRYDEATRRAPTILLKFEPGAKYPAHNHPAGEECFVLEGDVRFGGQLLRQGDYLYTAPGNKHGVVSDSGCIVLLNVPEEVEVIAPKS